jgi:hypothetical protein
MSDPCVTCEDQRALADAPERMSVTPLTRCLEAFNVHDVDAVRRFCSDDWILEMPPGPDPRGQRIEGRDLVRRGLGSPLPAVATSPRGRRRI